MPVFDADALRWFAKRSDPTLALEDAWPQPSWPSGQQAIVALFGLSRSSHFLRHHRGLLPNLRERQVTEALKALLVGDPANTLRRCQALLNALVGESAPTLKAVNRITADANDRIDLAIHTRLEDGTLYCLVIEAKLDAELATHQLQKYQNGLKAEYPQAGQRCLWVVATAQSTKTKNLMARKAHHEWRFMTWRRLLINWQRLLPDQADSDVLALFSEVWKRSGGR